MLLVVVVLVVVVVVVVVVISVQFICRTAISEYCMLQFGHVQPALHLQPYTSSSDVIVAGLETS